MKVPIGGVSKNGVNNAMPAKPNFNLICTYLRLDFVNTFDFFLENNLMIGEINLSANKIKHTVNIMPAALAKAVSQTEIPRAKPAIGPPKNFSVLARATVIYFEIFSNAFKKFKIQNEKKNDSSTTNWWNDYYLYPIVKFKIISCIGIINSEFNR